jgi:Glycosyl hydrolase family 76
MDSRPDHRLASRIRLRRNTLLVLLLAAACVPASASASPLRTHVRTAASPASPYPAGATRPSRAARPSEFARAASTPTGGSSGPTVGFSKHASKKRPKPKPKPVLHGDPARAVLAFEAMQRAYYIPGSGLYQGEPFSFLWPFSQALAATVTMSHVTGIAKIPGLSAAFARELSARLIGLHSYLDIDNSGAPEGTFTSTLAAFDGTVAPPTGPGGNKYYDDNEWVGIELMRMYELTHNAPALGSAEAIMAFVMAGWDTDPELACPGGVPFSNSSENLERNTVTDGPGAELALQLYRATGNPQYLAFAEMAYEWVRRCLLSSNGLYADHIGPHGAVAQTYWSYNQGSMIGAGTLLYQATGNGAYLYQARQTAQAALAYYTPERLGSEIPFFVSVYFRNMLYLDSVTHDPPGPKLAQPYVDYAWQHLRLTNNLFVFGSPPSGQLLVQAAIAQIYGLLSSSPSTYF